MGHAVSGARCSKSRDAGVAAIFTLNFIGVFVVLEKEPIS